MKGNKIVKEIQTIQTDMSGNIVSFQQVQEKFVPREEPDFIKLYLDHVLIQARTRIDLSPVLMEILKMANYADDNRGGMYVILNKYAKELIGNVVGVTIPMIDKNIKQFVESSVLIRIARGTYLLNPYYFGKGHWTDIKQIRATIDFNTNEFNANLKFSVRDGGGKVIEGIYQDEAGNIIDNQTGEVIKQALPTGTEG